VFKGNVHIYAHFDLHAQFNGKESEGMAELDLNPFFFEGDKTGCLLIHGFSGSPPEMRPMGEYLAERGMTVLGVRLAGHGKTPEAMAATGWRDWIASAEEGLQELKGRCDRVFVAGLSMGGSITLHLTAHYPVDGAVVMSAPAYIDDWRLPFLPLVAPFLHWITPDMESDLTDPEAKSRYSAYSRLPTRAILNLRTLLRLVRRELDRVRVPLLIMQGKGDRAIPPTSAQIIYDGVSSSDKEIVWWLNSGHAITIDSEREAVWRRAHAFITAHGGSP
jgi:carboxylesterase